MKKILDPKDLKNAYKQALGVIFEKILALKTLCQYIVFFVSYGWNDLNDQYAWDHLELVTKHSLYCNNLCF